MTAEYAKNTPDDIVIRLTVVNRGPKMATLHLLPTLWFRNTWAWKPGVAKPLLEQTRSPCETEATVMAQHESLGEMWWICDRPDQFLFTENETNFERLFNSPNHSPYVKDGINNCVVNGDAAAVNPREMGTKVSACYRRILDPGESWTVKLRLTDQKPSGAVLGNPSIRFSRSASARLASFTTISRRRR